LPGSSSIFMALMASGFSGQNFAFTGYLPIDKNLRVKRIKELERELVFKQQAQIFMETPYRNNHLFDDLVKIVMEMYCCVLLAIFRQMMN